MEMSTSGFKSHLRKFFKDTGTVCIAVAEQLFPARSHLIRRWSACFPTRNVTWFIWFWLQQNTLNSLVLHNFVLVCCGKAIPSLKEITPEHEGFW